MNTARQRSRSPSQTAANAMEPKGNPSGVATGRQHASGQPVATASSTFVMLLLAAELLCEERGRVRAPRDVGRLDQPVHGLAHVREALRLDPQLRDSSLKR